MDSSLPRNVSGVDNNIARMVWHGMRDAGCGMRDNGRPGHPASRLPHEPREIDVPRPALVAEPGRRLGGEEEADHASVPGHIELRKVVAEKRRRDAQVVEV